MCMSPAEETLAVSTDRGQLYSINLSSAEMKRVLLLAQPNRLTVHTLQLHDFDLLLCGASPPVQKSSFAKA